MLNQIVRYFDLQSNNREIRAQGHSGAKKPAPVIPQYLVVVAGVVVEPFLRAYMASGAWNLPSDGIWGRVVFGLIVGVIILPGIYRAAFDPAKPILIQLFALFPLGIGWQSLFTAATKVATG